MPLALLGMCSAWHQLASVSLILPMLVTYTDILIANLTIILIVPDLHTALLGFMHSLMNFLIAMPTSFTQLRGEMTMCRLFKPFERPPEQSLIASIEHSPQALIQTDLVTPLLPSVVF